MSYARFGWGGSDVYIYLDVGGYLCCCGCVLDKPWRYDTTAEMLAHLDEHRRAGHCVPDDCVEELKADAAENDAWIAERGPESE